MRPPASSTEAPSPLSLLALSCAPSISRLGGRGQEGDGRNSSFPARATAAKTTTLLQTTATAVAAASITAQPVSAEGSPFFPTFRPCYSSSYRYEARSGHSKRTRGRGLIRASPILPSRQLFRRFHRRISFIRLPQFSAVRNEIGRLLSC